MNGEAAFKVSKSEPDRVQFGWTDSLDAVGLGDMAENCITISVFHIGRYR